MPFKNTSKYLKECMESIMSQSYQNWELIAVNDHSEDGSLKIANSVANLDSRIHVYTSKGKGIIDALHLAFSKSTGQLITRMDADDIMAPKKIETLAKNLTEKGTGHVATGLVKYFCDTELGEGFLKYEKWLNSLTSTGTNFDDLYKECVIPSPCWMVYRKDLEKCEAFEPNYYPEDYDLVFRFYKYELKVIPCNETLHHWRDYSTRTSRTDPNYADHSFLDIKLKYFLELDSNSERNLVLWGAGAKGKNLAKQLLHQNIEFHWICDNPKKIGKDIYDKKMLDWKEIKNIPNSQSIISVASPEAQKEIKSYFQSEGSIKGKDYFFFC